jgi:hypothetical protein
MKRGQSKYDSLMGSTVGNWRCEGFAGNYRLNVTCISCGDKYQVIPRDFNRGLGCKNCFPRWGSRSKNFKGIGEISISYIKQLQSNAKTRNLKFDVSFEYLWNLFLLQNRKCALSGQELSFGIHRNGKTKEQTRTASLDRINNSIGYIKGNIQWLHKDVNMMKKHYSQEYFINICKLVYDNTSSSLQKQNTQD